MLLGLVGASVPCPPAIKKVTFLTHRHAVEVCVLTVECGESVKRVSQSTHTRIFDIHKEIGLVAFFGVVCVSCPLHNFRRRLHATQGCV